MSDLVGTKLLEFSCGGSKFSILARAYCIVLQDVNWKLLGHYSSIVFDSVECMINIVVMTC